MPYSIETYQTLIEEVGEGGLADKLLEKWLADEEEGTVKFVNLANSIYDSGSPRKINGTVRIRNSLIPQLRGIDERFTT